MQLPMMQKVKIFVATYVPRVGATKFCITIVIHTYFKIIMNALMTHQCVTALLEVICLMMATLKIICDSNIKCYLI